MTTQPMHKDLRDAADIIEAYIAGDPQVTIDKIKSFEGDKERNRDVFLAFCFVVRQLLVQNGLAVGPFPNMLREVATDIERAENN